MVHNWLICLLLLFNKCGAILCLDNRSVASEDQLIDDPFLVLRNGSNFENCCLLSAKYQSGMIVEKLDTINDYSNESEILIIGEKHFDYSKPRFILSNPCIAWSVEDVNQTLIYETCEPSDSIKLSDLNETFLNPDTTYFFKAKDEKNLWSKPFAFTVSKPEPISDICFSKEEKNCYKLEWKSNGSPNTQYLIFASNDLDFVPEIFIDKRVDSINGDQIEFSLNKNLVLLTASTRIIIDDSYAYYRIIALDQDQLSVPSSLIYIYDNNLFQKRTVLKCKSGKLAKRIELASGFPCPKTFLPNQEIWEKLKPFFLPDNHPARRRLDKIFSATRVTLDQQTFKDAGFIFKERKSEDKVLVGFHMKCPEIVVKTYLDCQSKSKEWENWLRRIEGADATREFIKKHHYTNFEAPKKWIYPLPFISDLPNDDQYKRKYFALIADNMGIKSDSSSKKCYKKIDKRNLSHLYQIIEGVGLSDSPYIKNIPFTQRNTIAFVDTEQHHQWPIYYHRLVKYLSEEMGVYWEQLTSENKR